MKNNKKLLQIISWSFFILYAVIIFVFDLENWITKTIAFALLGTLGYLDFFVFKSSDKNK